MIFGDIIIWTQIQNALVWLLNHYHEWLATRGAWRSSF